MNRRSFFAAAVGGLSSIPALFRSIGHPKRVVYRLPDRWTNEPVVWEVRFPTKAFPTSPASCGRERGAADQPATS
jgi:hypothetical protein